jgi:DNA-binding NarL/FixJ family response regulator
MRVDVKMPFLPGDAFVSLFGKQGELLRPTVVLFSAIDEFTLRKTALACGADGYISKTDSALELARKIAGFLRDSDAKLRSAVAEPS